MCRKFLLSFFLVVLSINSYSEEWPGFLKIEGKKGNYRNLGRAMVMAPLWQTRIAALFGDVRYMVDNQSDREANLGLCYRRVFGNWDIASRGIILGASAYYDYRRTSFGNSFYQGVFGAEAIGEDFQISFNLYRPQNKTHEIHNLKLDKGWDTHSNGLISSFMALIDPVTLREEAMRGYDINGRFKFAFDEDVNLWGSVGHYHFSRDGANIVGPMLCVEFEVLNQLNVHGSRLSLGGEVRKNKGFTADKYFVVSFGLPLGLVPKGEGNLKGLWYEMTRYVQRDVDIVTGLSF